MKLKVIATVLLLFVLSPVPAWAQFLACPTPSQNSEENKHEGRWYYRIGVSSFNTKQYGKSAEAFACVIKLVPESVMARYYLAMSQDRLGQTALALELYEWFLANGTDASWSYKAEVANRVQEIKRQQKLQVASEKTEQEMSTLAESERWAKEETRAKQEDERRSFEQGEAPSGTGKKGITSRWWFWTGVGTTSLFTGTAAVMGILALREKPEDGSSSSGDEKAKTKYNRYVTVGEFALGGAVLGVAALGVTLWLWEPSKSSNELNSGMLLAPTCGSEGCMLTLSVRF